MANPFGDEEVIPLTSFRRKSSNQVEVQGKWSGDWYEKSCVIILGDTGLGKSTMVNLCTGNEASTGRTPEAITKVNQIYTDNLHGPKYPKWMDTVGLNDTSDDPNFLVFQRFLRELKSEGVTSVHAIIWAISPNIREKKEFKAQATQIEAIFKGVDIHEKAVNKVDIWKNVILLCEKSFKEKLSFQGAKAAIRKYSGCADNVKCVQMSDFGADENGKTRLDSNEAKRTRDALMEALGDLTSPIYLNFKTMICRDCGQIDDPRLMMLKCHWQPEKKWQKAPSMCSCGQYIKYMFQADKLVCANENCLKPGGNRASWSKPSCNCCWKYTNGDYKTCAVVRMIGNLKVGNLEVGDDTANQIKFKERHNLEEVDSDSCCYNCSSCCY